jgi:enamine deaminase RidA (YjgF/YER057c/UK114 family)
MKPEAKLKEMGIELPWPVTPEANYIKAARTNNLIFLASHDPRRPDGTLITGKLGQDLSLKQGYEAARWTAVNLPASLKKELGDLGKIRRIVKLLAMVNCTPDFYDQPKVINGASDLLVEVFALPENTLDPPSV